MENVQVAHFYLYMVVEVQVCVCSTKIKAVVVHCRQLHQTVNLMSNEGESHIRYKIEKWPH